MAKGGSFEREVSGELSKWFTDGQSPDIFWRSNGSGSRFTVRKRGEAASQAGDITYSDPKGIPLIQHWCIEVKTGYGGKKRIKNKETKEVIARIQKQWDLLDCIDSQKKVPAIIEFWGQCKRDAILSNKTPILIFRRNVRAICIAIEHSYFLELAKYFGDYKFIFLTIKTGNEHLNIMSLKEFFAWIPGNFLEIMFSEDLKHKKTWLTSKHKIDPTVQK